MRAPILQGPHTLGLRRTHGAQQTPGEAQALGRGTATCRHRCLRQELGLRAATCRHRRRPGRRNQHIHTPSRRREAHTHVTHTYTQEARKAAEGPVHPLTPIPHQTQIVPPSPIPHRAVERAAVADAHDVGHFELPGVPLSSFNLPGVLCCVFVEISLFVVLVVLRGRSFRVGDCLSGSATARPCFPGFASPPQPVARVDRPCVRASASAPQPRLRVFASPPRPIAPPSCIPDTVSPPPIEPAACDVCRPPLPASASPPRPRPRVLDRSDTWHTAVPHLLRARRPPRRPCSLFFICLSSAVGVAEPFAVYRRPCEQGLWRGDGRGRAYVPSVVSSRGAGRCGNACAGLALRALRARTASSVVVDRCWLKSAWVIPPSSSTMRSSSCISEFDPA